jgi:hypothetical protein
MRYHNRPHAKPKNAGSSSFLWMLFLLCSLIVFGVLFCASMVPNEQENERGPGTNSIITKQDNRSLRQKILDWLPRHHEHLVEHLPEEAESIPDWNTEFWSPVDVDISNDPMVTLCKLNFKEYSENPHLYAMSKFVEELSRCVGKNRRRERLRVLIQELKDKDGTPEGRYIKPNGFIFHESRVGSTLVANTLASDPWSMVYSESSPPANALLHCTSCTREQSIEIFRDVVTLMGRSPFHKRLFFKFQSITTTKMEIALEVIRSLQ